MCVYTGLILRFIGVCMGFISILYTCLVSSFYSRVYIAPVLYVCVYMYVILTSNMCMVVYMAYSLSYMNNHSLDQ